MKLFKLLTLAVIFLTTGLSHSQEEEKEERVPGHYNNNPFKQLYEEFSTPNQYRSASGAPGPAYYQQQADYVMDIELDDKNKTAKLIRVPKFSEVPFPVIMEPSLVIEYYSR